MHDPRFMWGFNDSGQREIVDTQSGAVAIVLGEYVDNEADKLAEFLCNALERQDNA